ncbi:alpha/beta fold hydrolase [Streptomyces sp. ASQP_92]|uniref:thioesterase II family protein n=1 Tax=Streptomyces sp. ASQP_92 TaxID=2979116 RepID=UPI0021BEEA63|nr:alpha/beta fold hydrolase [Streptomyces sp. ASQP_92]MCT9089947.1 alpha/beta fold hydrolase [Streptomyces sp. ASQP_92]
MRSDSDRWAPVLRRAAGPRRIRLICFPYAGGGPDIFRSWADGLDAGVELVAVRLPGRGPRLREAMYENWDSLLAETFDALSAAGLLDTPHAFYGHSFGGRLAYEMAHLTASAHPGATRHLFVSGSRSPNAPQARPYLHELPGERYLDAVRAMGGTPAEILDSPMMMRLFLPTMRADMRLAELWDDRHGAPGVDVPLTALYGRDDPVDGYAAMRDWKLYSSRACEVVELPGGHFFLDTHRDRLLETINARLEGSR